MRSFLKKDLMANRYIHLIRHGHYYNDKTHEKHGQLTPLGKHQARQIGTRLTEYPLSNIYVSTMTRAIETAEIISKSFQDKTTQHCDLIIEGIPEFPANLIKEKSLKKTALKQTKERMDSAFTKYFVPNETEEDLHQALVCHGNIIRYLVLKAIGVKTSSWIDLDIYQCSLSTVRVEKNGETKLITFGEIGHIIPEKRTFL